MSCVWNQGQESVQCHLSQTSRNSKMYDVIRQFTISCVRKQKQENVQCHGSETTQKYENVTGPPLVELSPRREVFTHQINALQALARGINCTTQSTALFLFNLGRDHKQVQYHPQEFASYFFFHHPGHLRGIRKTRPPALFSGVSGYLVLFGKCTMSFE